MSYFDKLGDLPDRPEEPAGPAPATKSATSRKPAEQRAAQRVAQHTGQRTARPQAKPVAPVPSVQSGPRRRDALIGLHTSVTAELHRELRMLSVQKGVTLIYLLGEAIDDLLIKNGIEPYNERGAR